MKIAILGGTGNLGRGLALRWARIHHVVVGSRREEKARALAEEYRAIATQHYAAGMKGVIEGAENRVAVKGAEAVILSIPHKYIINFVRGLKRELDERQIIVSPVVPMERGGGGFRYTPHLLFKDRPSAPKSAAEIVASELGAWRVVAALHSLPTAKLADLDVELNYDVILSGDDRRAVETISRLVSEIPGLHPLYAGPLAVSSQLESLTPLLLNISLHSGIRDPSIRILE